MIMAAGIPYTSTTYNLPMQPRMTINKLFAEQREEICMASHIQVQPHHRLDNKPHLEVYPYTPHYHSLFLLYNHS